MTQKQINFIERWIEALRSGTYQQGRNMLRTEFGTYCCLGVACSLLDNTLWSRETVRIGSESRSGYNYGNEEDCSPTELPNFVLKAIGITDKTQADLIELNDDERFTFDQIADWLEDNVLNSCKR